MDVRDGQLNWRFVLQWLVTVAVGGTVAALLASLFAWRVGQDAEDILGERVSAVITGCLYGAILALGIGLGSGFLLRTGGISVGRWTGATILAGAVGMAIAFTFALTFPDADAMSEIVAGLIMGLSLGLPIGISQSFVLRRHQFPANSWIIVSACAAIIALGVGVPLSAGGRELLSVATMALLFAVITGLGMMWLQGQETAAAT